MGVIGILVAAAIIGGVSALNLPPPITVTTARITSVRTTTSYDIETSTTTTISNSTVPDGTLAVQIADLLNLPAGVTHVYVSYSDIEVHTILANMSTLVPGSTGK